MKTELLEGYLDTSGKEPNIKDIALVVTVCLATPPKWATFKDELNEVLKETPVEKDEETGNYVFHATEFWAKWSKSYRVEDGWTKSKRDSVYRSLIEVITRNTKHRTGFCVFLEDYCRFLKKYHPVASNLFGQAGTFAMTQSFMRCGEWAKANNYPAEFSFETNRGDELWTEIKPSYDNFVKDEKNRKSSGFKVDGFTCGDKKKHIPIQAADLVAWEFTKYIKQVYERPVEAGNKIKPSKR